MRLTPTVLTALFLAAAAVACTDEPEVVLSADGTDDAGGKADGGAAFRRCTGRPFPAPGATGFRHTTSKVAALTGARHRAQDVITAPNSRAELVAKFAYGPTWKDLEDENAAFYLDNCAGWVAVATRRTDDDGLATLAVNVNLPAGVYEVRAVARGDASTTLMNLWVLPAGTRVAVTDIDGTMTTADTELFKQIFDGSYVPQVAPDTVTTSGSQPQVHFTVKTKKPVYFITIDDGVRKQQAAVDYVRSINLPVTTFLYDGVVDGEYDYFKKFSAYDAVQNHTMEHKALSKKSTDVQYQICEAQRIYEKKYGERPWILRPPYGAGMYESNTAAQRNRILDAAASCGIKHIAMWNVVVDADGSVSYASGDKIRRGDIVLLHFEGDVAANLKKVVRLGEASGLTPASLSAFLGK